MQDSSTALTAVLQFRQDLQARLRDGVRRAIETALDDEPLSASRADDPLGSLLDCAVGIVGAVIRGEETSPWPDLSTAIREEPFEESLLAMFCASVIALWELPAHPEDRQAFSQAVLA